MSKKSKKSKKEQTNNNRAGLVSDAQDCMDALDAILSSQLPEPYRAYFLTFQRLYLIVGTDGLYGHVSEWQDSARAEIDTARGLILDHLKIVDFDILRATCRPAYDALQDSIRQREARKVCDSAIDAYHRAKTRIPDLDDQH